MTGKLQGFVIERNLEETPVSLTAINNLGEAPIADDISLFKNNKRNVSTISVIESNISTLTNYITIPTATSVFTNKTRVSKDGIFYYIKNSNGINRFQLSNDINLISTVALNNQFVGTYTRSDEITFENFTNYAKTRRPSIENLPRGLGITTETAVGEFTANVKEKIANFEEYVNFFKNLKFNSVVKTESFNTDIDFLNEGHLSIIDPDGVNNNSLTANSGPGVFIYNAATGSKIRAFSDSKNVWEPNPANTYLQTTARKITTGVLTVIANTVASNTVKIEQKPGSTENILIQTVTPITISEDLINSAFNHKVRVIINGEDYFLCLSNTASMV